MALVKISSYQSLGAGVRLRPSVARPNRLSHSKACAELQETQVRAALERLVLC